jgi:uncharacterized protein CbrC (UPF0167 family)
MREDGPVPPVPHFRYHPDPVATGSAVAGRYTCEVCREVTGLRYDGPIDGQDVDALCLSCIASGVAAVRLGEEGHPAEFTAIPGSGVPADLSVAILDEIHFRTPGYFAWQDSRWLYHCGDGAAFLGRVGWDQLRDDPNALASLHAEAREVGLDETRAEAWIRRLAPDGDFTGYLFRCLHCGVHLAYSDAN